MPLASLLQVRPSAGNGLWLLGLAAVSLVFTASAPASRAGKTLAPGCWKGTGVFNGSFKKGTVSATVTGGKLKFGLVVGAGKNAAAIGAMDTAGHGFGTVTAGGSSFAMEVNMIGDFTLTGHPADVIVDGQYRYRGAADFQGTTLPVDIKLPVEDAPLVINSATATYASGQFGKSKWTATRIAPIQAKLSGPACLKKAGV